MVMRLELQGILRREAYLEYFAPFQLQINISFKLLPPHY